MILSSIATSLGSFQIDTDAYPKAETEIDFSAVGLDKKYYEGETTDGYGMPIKYVSDGKTYTLTSYGSDKAAGGGDDVVMKDGQLVK